MPPYRIAKAGIAQTFQIPQTFPSLNEQKSISVGSRFGATGGLDPAYVDEVIRFVDLKQECFQSTGLLNLLDKNRSFFITCSRESRCTYNPILKTSN
jgi:ABC-type branched-subunit amino acid transport system ATPase component